MELEKKYLTPKQIEKLPYNLKKAIIKYKMEHPKKKTKMRYNN